MKKTLQTQSHLVLIGVCIIITIVCICIYQFLIIPETQKMLYSKYPEIEKITTAVQNRFRNGSTYVQLRLNTVDGKKPTSTLTVTYSSTNFLEEQGVKEIGKISCTQLKQLNKKYDKVIVVSRKSFFQFETPFFHWGQSISYPGSCK